MRGKAAGLGCLPVIMLGFFFIGSYAQTVAVDVAQYPQTFGMAFGCGCFGMT